MRRKTLRFIADNVTAILVAITTIVTVGTVIIWKLLFDIEES